MVDDVTCPQCRSALPPRATACSNCGTTDFDTVSDEPAWRPRSTVEELDPRRAPSAPRPVLQIRIGESVAEVEDGEDCLLGRSAESPLADVLRRYRNVSAVHATIRWSRGQALVRDESSRNGTHVGDTGLSQESDYPLPLPAVVRLANNCFVHVSVRETQPDREPPSHRRILDLLTEEDAW